MNILKVDHIGIAVKNLAESSKLYEMLGIKSAGVEEVAEQKVKVSLSPRLRLLLFLLYLPADPDIFGHSLL